MRIAIDLDGPMYQYQSAFRYMANHYLGAGLPPLREFWTTWDAPDAILGDVAQKFMREDAVELGLYRYGHVVKGAVVGVRLLAARGHELVVATHRPRSAVADTIDWLSYVRLPFSEVHILSDGQPKTSVDADVLIDDRPENVLDWAAAGRAALLFSAPWNYSAVIRGRVARAHGWPDVCDMIERLA